MEKVSNRGMLVWALLYTLGPGIMLFPQSLTVSAKQDGWLSPVVTIVFLPPLVWMYGKLGSRLASSSLAEYAITILGPPAGICVAVLFAAYMFAYTSILCRISLNFMITMMMPDTPIEAFAILMIAVIVYGARQGIETMVRASELAFPWLMALFMLMLLFLIPDAEGSRLLPIGENGLGPIVYGGIQYALLMAPVGLLPFFPYMNRPDRGGIALLSGLTIGSVFMLIITLMSIVVLGESVASRSQYTSYTLAKTIDAGGYLRLEALIAIVWLVTSLLKAATAFCSTIETIGPALGLRDNRLLTFPFAVLLYGATLWNSTNVTELSMLISEVWLYVSVLFVLIVPVVLLAIGAMSKRVVSGKPDSGGEEGQTHEQGEN